MCLGGASGELASASNFAIGLMLVLVFLVLGSFGGFIVYLVRKARLAEMDDLNLNNDLTGYNR